MNLAALVALLALCIAAPLVHAQQVRPDCTAVQDDCDQLACLAACNGCTGDCLTRETFPVQYQCSTGGDPFTRNDVCTSDASSGATTDVTSADNDNNDACDGAIDDCDRRACERVCGQCRSDCLVLESFPPQYSCADPALYASAYDVCDGWTNSALPSWIPPQPSPDDTSLASSLLPSFFFLLALIVVAAFL